MLWDSIEEGIIMCCLLLVDAEKCCSPGCIAFLWLSWCAMELRRKFEALKDFSCMKSFRLKSWGITDLAVFLNVESASCRSHCGYKHLMPCIFTASKSKVLMNLYEVTGTDISIALHVKFLK